MKISQCHRSKCHTPIQAETCTSLSESCRHARKFSGDPTVSYSWKGKPISVIKTHHTVAPNYSNTIRRKAASFQQIIRTSYIVYTTSEKDKIIIGRKLTLVYKTKENDALGQNRTGQKLASNCHFLVTLVRASPYNYPLAKKCNEK